MCLPPSDMPRFVTKVPPGILEYDTRNIRNLHEQLRDELENIEEMVEGLRRDVYQLKVLLLILCVLIVSLLVI
ncbi:hypothetical protein BT93_L4734 [Corymbia citriodora subsp. variegata]|uniref:Uncharacterized protein n=1 Tax=Corymbia citriodora subsp. variegata TaxID=360336 RepID=A0A8T0CTN2_CORYI|nr:hypothetical protein BT93_L4734 [Corymbia citriodora subsp. variegata]KAF7850987.1 hypothetical protein BT93_L4734 [Corymbia citriodora subsp. variegata]KAF7850988.1 hypothetical protein BT93_L4734 [Corymbia citriodora subsp. variegata]KAF7850989.1 hypothetical protein BT93_L4734 [Corymbia citriodora subsp. variegata]